MLVLRGFSAVPCLFALAAAGCAVDATQPEGLGAPVAESKLTGGSGSVSLFEDRLQHARYYPEVGTHGVIRQCQANPIEDGDGNDWTTQKKGGSTFSKLVEPRGVVLVREVALGAGDFDPLGNLIFPDYRDDRWGVLALGTGHLMIALWRDALGRPVALNTAVHADVAPIGPEDGWIGMLDEPGDEVEGAHDLRNEAFTPESPILALFEAAVAEARGDGTALRLDCDAHVQYAAGVVSWIQRNNVELR